MKDNKKTPEELKEQDIKTVAQAEQIFEQESAPIIEEVVAVVQTATPAATSTAPVAGRGPGGPGGRGRGPGGPGGRGGDRDRKGGPRKPGVTESGFIEKVVSINRVAKTNKGGTRISFSALVVIGDGKGKVGYGLGKAGEVATSIKKALNAAKKAMITINRNGTTITHEILGECGAASVLLKPASDGTGVIASGPVRAICDGAGISNILTKCHKSNNPINVVKATFDGLSRLKQRKAKSLPLAAADTL